jgi:hypothetical protein
MMRVEAKPDSLRFLADCKRFGGDRAKLRLRRSEAAFQFRRRQGELIAVGCWFLFVYVLIGMSGMGAGAIFFFSVATSEAERMKACGRYYRCGRSIEMGLP